MQPTDVRRLQDPESGGWWFSVVDTIALTTSSKDPQNYWKVLKNRLKKEQNELVTKINQLKMRARDGKSYLTDTATAETLLGILKYVPKVNFEAANLLFGPSIESPHPTPLLACTAGGLDKERVPEAGEVADAELLLDAYEDGAYIYIEAMLGGTAKEDLDIRLEKNKITISGRRIPPPPHPLSPPLPARPAGGLVKERVQGEVFLQELYWVSFSRTLDLPYPVDTERAEAGESQGHLVIRIPKLT